MKKWMKQLNRVIVLTLALVCLFGCLAVTAEAEYRDETCSSPQGKWVEYPKGWCFQLNNGTWAKNAWIVDKNGNYYYIGSDEYMVKSAWVDGGNYYVGSDGVMYVNKWDPTGVYYCGSDGKYLKSAWVPPGNDASAIKTAYVDGNGKRVYNQWILNYTYYINSTGQYQTSWLNLNGTYYNFRHDGLKLTGWQDFGADGCFYLNPSSSPITGVMLANGAHKLSNGKYYYFDSKGVQKYGWQADGRYYNNARKDQGYALTNTTTPDGYYVGSEGFKHTGWVGKTYYSGGLSKTVTLTLTNNATGTNAKNQAFKYTLNVWYENTSAAADAKSYAITGTGTQTITLPLNATYSISQEKVDGYTTSQSAGASKTKLTGNATVTFTNTQQTYTLTVNNTVEGSLKQKDKEFAITVTYTKPGENAVTDTFPLKDGDSKPFTLPYGTTYTVKCASYTSDGYTTSGTVESAATLKGAASVNVKQSLPQYTLSVQNTVHGAGQAYSYTVTAKYADGSTYTVPDGTFTLNAGGTKNITLPKAGTYTVVQNSVSGYQTDGNATRTGTMSANATVEYVNRQLVPLTVTNTVIGADKEFNYTLALGNGTSIPFTLANGSWTNKETPCGLSYTVTQTADENYQTTVTDNASGTVASGITVAYTNTHTPRLTVKNTVVGADKEFSYTVVIDDGEPITFNLAPGATWTSDKLLYGTTYSVTQVPNDDYQTIQPENASGQLNANETVVFVNKQLVSLTVTNTVVGAGKDFSYTVVIGGVTQEGFTLGHNGTKTFDNIPHGTDFIVTQEAEDGYSTDPGYVIEGTVAEGATAAFTNTQMLKLTVTNDLDGAGGPFKYVVTIGEETLPEFELGDNGSWTSEKAYPFDTAYTVTQTVPEGFTYDTSKVDECNGKLTANATVAYTNTQMLNLTVKNLVSGADEPFTYTVVIGGVDQGEIELKNGETWTSSNYRYDSAYTVVQTEPDGLNYSTVVAEGSEGATLAECTAVTYQNTQLLTLTIINSVVGEDNTIQYKVSVNGGEPTVLTLENNTSGTVDVPFGSKYSIEQVLPEDYKFDVVTEGETSVEGMTTEKRVTFTNTQLVTLTLKAEVKGNMANKDMEFSFTVALVGQESQTVALKHGETKEFEVPYGTAYTITQQSCSDEGYKIKIDNGGVETEGVYTATGEAKGDIEVTFTNSKSFAIPTAVSLTVLPFLGMVGFGAVLGVTQLLGGSRRSRRGRYSR